MPDARSSASPGTAENASGRTGGCLTPGVAGIGSASLLAGAAKLAGGALVDDPRRRRSIAVGGYATTAVLSAAVGAAGSVWQVGLLRAGA